MVRIHPTALVETQDIGEGTDIWAFAHVMAGVSIGERCKVGDHVFIEAGCKIGNNVTIKNQVLLWDGVTIENDVFIGPRVTFTNDRYPRSPRMAEAKNRYSHRENWLVETLVRQGCSIGAGAIVCPGVELGRYCVVGAGAVVTRSVPDFAMVIGNPARQVADVCLCGQPLSSPRQTTECQQCGRSGCSKSQV